MTHNSVRDPQISRGEHLDPIFGTLSNAFGDQLEIPSRLTILTDWRAL